MLIYVINVQSFGWTIQFHLPAAFLIQASVLMVLATALAGSIRRGAHSNLGTYSTRARRECRRRTRHQANGVAGAVCPGDVASRAGTQGYGSDEPIPGSAHGAR